AVGGCARARDGGGGGGALGGGRGNRGGEFFDLLGGGEGRPAVLLDDQLTHQKVMLHDGRRDCKGTPVSATSASRDHRRADPGRDRDALRRCSARRDGGRDHTGFATGRDDHSRRRGRSDGCHDGT